LGLGLAFSRWAVEANHGRIYARNLPDRDASLPLTCHGSQFPSRRFSFDTPHDPEQRGWASAAALDDFPQPTERFAEWRRVVDPASHDPFRWGNKLFGSRGRWRADQYVRDVSLILLGRPFRESASTRHPECGPLNLNLTSCQHASYTAPRGA
jgi:hypothetical protein